MDEKLIAVQLDVDSFQRWVKDGIIRLSPSHQTNLPIVWPAMHDPQGNSHALLIQLPEKYERALSIDTEIYALIDEVEVISLPTEALTLEWKTRMKNLGEGWLPFDFRPEWVQPGSAEELPVVDDEIGSEPRAPIADEASTEETLQAEPEKDGQDEPIVESSAEADLNPTSETEQGIGNHDATETARHAEASEVVQQAEIPGFLQEASEAKPPEKDEPASSQAQSKKKRKAETTSQERESDAG